MRFGDPPRPRVRWAGNLFRRPGVIAIASGPARTLIGLAVLVGVLMGVTVPGAMLPSLAT